MDVVETAAAEALPHRAALPAVVQSGSVGDSGTPLTMWTWVPADRSTILTLCLQSRWLITGPGPRSTQRQRSPNCQPATLPARGMPWIAALDDFGPSGQVLELACGPGTWTSQLLSHADTVTAVDAAPEMLQIAAAKVRDNRPVSGCQGTAHPDV